MLTNNWRNKLIGIVTNTVNTYGNNVNEEGNAATDSANFINRMTARIGTGSEEEKPTNYNLNEPIDATKYQSTITFSANPEFNNTAPLAINAVVTNVSEESLEVREIGIFGNSYGTSTPLMMMARTVFDNAITIEPGG